MPAINSVEDAVLKAEAFVERYYSFRRLRKAQKENKTWVVEFEVGVLFLEVVKVKLDEESGKVIEYVAPGVK